MADDDAELIACIRYLLGLRPLKPEPIGLSVFRFSLDGERKQSRDEWARELGVTRQAVDQRYATDAITAAKAAGFKIAGVQATRGLLPAPGPKAAERQS